jgi:CRISPR-associated Csx2 family protein
VWEERSHTTRLFPEALARIFEPEKVIVFVTETAKNYRPSESEPRYVETLQAKLGHRVEWVDIPEGRSEQELWEIFDRVASTVDRGDTILLDITHAFRSIPMIVFPIAAYLRKTKGVVIERIVYGAFDARNPYRTPPQPEDRVPIFDLTPLLELLDWLGGVEFLLRRSDAILLAERLDRIQREAWQRRSHGDLPKHLQSVARVLQSFSQALHLARPRDVMNHAHSLLTTLEKVIPEAKLWAKPFALILEQIRSEAEKFAYDAPDRLDKENLQRQLGLIEHFIEKGLWVQAILLAREWVVSWIALQRGGGDWLDRNYREQDIEDALGSAAQRHRKESTQIPDWLDRLPKSEETARLWNWLTQLRNDVAHCGMRKDCADTASIERRAKEMLRRLKALMNDMPEHVLYGARIVIDLKSLYGEVAKLDELPHYIERAKELAGEGHEVVLTGQAPIWMYLAIAHALHGKARRLLYDSPVTGEVLIFDHTAR